MATRTLKIPSPSGDGKIVMGKGYSGKDDL